MLLDFAYVPNRFRECVPNRPTYLLGWAICTIWGFVGSDELRFGGSGGLWATAISLINLQTPCAATVSVHLDGPICR